MLVVVMLMRLVSMMGAVLLMMMLMGAVVTVVMGMKMCHIFAVYLISRCKDTAHPVQLGCKPYL